jgi:nucleoside-diphosphate-sugar epimerase
MKIVVTGSASHLAQVLLPRLLSDSRIEKVVGLDWRAKHPAHPKYRHVLMDIRAAEVAKIFEDANALIHLGFVVLQSHLGSRRADREWMRDINVNGSANVFLRAAQVNVPRLIHVSSAAVYDLATPYRGALPESHPRRALEGFAYGEDQVALEEWLDSFGTEKPNTRLIRLRPHAIVGPHAQPFLNFLVRTRFFPQLPDPQPLVQCVHEEDVAQAIVNAVFADARGAFNLSPLDSTTLRDMKGLLHSRPLALSMPTARTLLATAYSVFRLGTDPSWLANARYNFVLHSQRARRELGWAPKYDSVRDCVLSLKLRHGRNR